MTVSYVERQQASPEDNAFYDKAEARFEMLLNIFKVFGHTPELDTVFTDMIMAILKATRRNDCQYCVVQHETLSKRLGISEEKINDIGDDRYKTSPHFTEAEKALMDLTVQIGIDANRVPKELWDRLHTHFTEPQIVEAVFTITIYIAVSKFGDALGVELEPVFSGIQPVLEVIHRGGHGEDRDLFEPELRLLRPREGAALRPWLCLPRARCGGACRPPEGAAEAFAATALAAADPRRRRAHRRLRGPSAARGHGPARRRAGCGVAVDRTLERGPKDA